MLERSALNKTLYSTKTKCLCSNFRFLFSLLWGKKNMGRASATKSHTNNNYPQIKLKEYYTKQTLVTLLNRLWPSIVITSGRTIASAPWIRSGCVLPHTTGQACNTMIRWRQSRRKRIHFYSWWRWEWQKGEHILWCTKAAFNIGNSCCTYSVDQRRWCQIEDEKDKKVITVV